MSPNRRQARVLYGALAVFALSALFPPWSRLVTLYNTPGGSAQVRQASGYAPLWSPPKRLTMNPAGSDTYAIDWPRLTLSWIAVGCVAGVLLLALRDHRAT